MTPPAPARVLIVEDETIIAMGIQLSLQNMGYVVTGVAGTGERALAAAAVQPPDVVLMDINIRGPIDGVATAQIIRERHELPVVFLTAHSDSATVERAVVAEPDGYIVKPVSDGALRSAIELALYRRRLERESRDQQTWANTMLHSIADGVLALDLRGRVSYANPAAERLTGVPAGTAAGRPIGELVHSVEGEADPEAVVERALDARAPVDGPSGVLRGHDDQLHFLSGTTAPVVDGERLLGAVMVVRDITEQRQMEKRIELLDRVASLGSLAVSVAHEVNNPLAIVMGELEMLLESLDDAELRGESTITLPIGRLQPALRDAQLGCERIARVVRDLREFTLPSAASRGRANVRRAAEWALRMARTQLRDRAQPHLAVADVGEVAMEEPRLGQVLTNLVTNAAHAIAPGRVATNHVRIDAVRQERGWVRITVADTGSGIPAHLCERIFDPFFTTKSRERGTGLGLAICRGLVEEAGGTLGVQSAVGQGTTFTIELPVATAPAVPQARRERPVEARVLIVDDELELAQVFGRMLRSCETTAVDSVAAALALLEESSDYDVLITDLMMPDGTGKDLYEAILERWPALAGRVLLCTGGALSGELQAFAGSLPRPPLFKPVSARELNAAVASVLKATQGAAVAR